MKKKGTAENFKLVVEHFGQNPDVLQSEADIFYYIMNSKEKNYVTDTAQKVVETLAYMADTKRVFIPFFWEIAHAFAAIPATSCTAERSFSSLRCIKNYLRNSTKQDRLTALSVLYIERAYCNQFVKCNIERVIDTFGSRSGRHQY